MEICAAVFAVDCLHSNATHTETIEHLQTSNKPLSCSSSNCFLFLIHLIPKTWAVGGFRMYFAFWGHFHGEAGWLIYNVANYGWAF